MATIVKSCDGDCSSSRDACSTGEQVCPPGYYCAFGSAFEAVDRETECLGGRCVNVDDPGDILKTGAMVTVWCNRCEPGYLIIEWKDEYKTKTGKADCEFVTSSCPQICDPYTPNTSECTDRAGCNTCEEAEFNCTDAGGIFTYPNNCSAEQQRVCSSYFSASAANKEEYDTFRPKGVVAGDTLLKCCGCDINLCPGCGNPCTGSCGGGSPCEANEYCSTSSVPCGECVPLSGL